MPAFVNNGPDIPERLLQAHEEGRVVFFCGAGISSSARLPNFVQLVKCLYKKFNVSPDPIQKSAIKFGRYDKAIELLESNVAGKREAVRHEIFQQLTPDLTSPNATVTHESLLTLSRNRDGHIRLVTTNFDRLFQEVFFTKNLDVKVFTAPLLPVPKKRWNGLVYLHGLLPKNPTTEELDQLVVSSGDFGLAYLTERWASRFVSELFQNYTVCFIGYSINDPVLRYMTDAHAADFLLDERVREMFAFGSFSKDNEVEKAKEWEAKNVTPILYRNHSNHSYLHRTLKVWANTYRDGVNGKKMIVAQHSTSPPLSSSRTDFAVGRLLWALTDEQATKFFAEMNPVPPLQWLEPLAEKQLGHEDLVRFGVTPNRKLENFLRFGYICRPTPYTLAKWMKIADSGDTIYDWDDVMYHLARWLTRHLDDPKLIIWLAKQGGQLNSQFAQLVQCRIIELQELKNEGKQKKLDKIRRDAPAAIPRPSMQSLWQIFLAGQISSHGKSLDLHDWLIRLKLDGLTPSLRIELRRFLTPRVDIQEPFDWEEMIGGTTEHNEIRNLVEWEIVLSGENVHYILNEVKNDSHWQVTLPELLQDFEVLLRDALDLKKALGGAEERSDQSYIDQPSISEHPQNNTYRDWTALIDLTRDAWLAMVHSCPKQAKLFAESWWLVPYPIFKRLALFAAANSKLIAPGIALNWLLSDNHRWLWSVETKREMFRLLVSLATKLSSHDRKKFEKAILRGPPLKVYRRDIEPNRLGQIIDNEIWVRLAKLKSADIELSQTAMLKLTELSERNPNWVLAPDESDEFSVWVGRGEDWRKFVTSPKETENLMKWLMEPSNELFQEDDWLQRCRDDFEGAIEALQGLSNQNEWPTRRWQEALQVWRDTRFLKKSWSNVPNVLANAPDDVIGELSQSLSSWLNAQASDFNENEGTFFYLCQRVLNFKYQSSLASGDDPLSVAINHPIGQTTQALLKWWYRQSLEDAGGLIEPIKSIFTNLCDKENQEFRHSRILLAAHVLSLFRVDSDWTKKSLLPLFNWQTSILEAHRAWVGFLRSPRRYDPLLLEIKRYFLDTATYYKLLGKYASRYAAFLTFEALDPSDVITTKEFREATRELPSEGLQSTAGNLIRALAGADDQRSEFWKNRIVPYLDSIWPRSIQSETSEVSAIFAELCIAAEDEFPDAVTKLYPWLKRIQFPGFLADQLNSSELCQIFPIDSLKFLDAIFGDYMQGSVGDLEQCLNDIKIANPSLARDTRFTRLSEIR